MDDEILSPAVGIVNMLDNHNVKYYACRRHTLITPTTQDRQRPVQVLVMAFGELTWVNVDESDLQPYTTLAQWCTPQES